MIHYDPSVDDPPHMTNAHGDVSFVSFVFCYYFSFELVFFLDKLGHKQLIRVGIMNLYLSTL